MKLQIIVDCRYGEESNWVSEINEDELNKLNPLLADIETRRGYYPTGDYYTYPDPSPKELYSSYSGWEILQRLLPTPTHGFAKISEVHIFTGDTMSLYL